MDLVGKWFTLSAGIESKTLASVDVNWTCFTLGVEQNSSEEETTA